MWLLIGVLAAFFAGQAAGNYENKENPLSELNCNRTYQGSQYSRDQTIKISMSSIAPMDVGKPITCYLVFAGTESQRVQVRVLSLRVGTYKKDVGCAYGQMKISDGSGDWTGTNFHPTVLCGYYEKNGKTRINMKRFSSQNSAKVDFWVTQASSTTGYDLEVKFLDLNRDGTKGSFGNYHSNNGKVSSTKCDWVIPVDRYCETRSCTIVTPGYPGIYPPNTECSYHLRSDKNKRVELMLNSRKGGKFDMKKSDNCEDDWVKVYDGPNPRSKLLGRFCAQDGGDFISSTDSLFVHFKSGAGGPPWSYSGFEGHVLPRWSSAPSGGLVEKRGICEYIISEDNSTTLEGSMNTPDHSIPPRTMCSYKFVSYPGHHVVIDYSITHMSENCNDYLEFYENDLRTAPRKCSDHIEMGKRNGFQYISYGPNVTLRYYHTDGHMVNRNPIFVDYEFRQRPKYSPRTPPTIYMNIQPTGATIGSAHCKASTLLVLTLSLIFYITS